MAIHWFPELNYQYDTERGTVYVRVGTVPKGTFATGKPDRGALLSGETGLLAARLIKNDRKQRAGTALDEIHSHYEALEPYAAPTSALDPVELKNSRKAWGDGQRRYAERLFVSDDMTCDVKRGDLYPGDEAADPTARYAEQPMDLPGSMPGRHFHSITYIGWRSYNT